MYIAKSMHVIGYKLQGVSDKLMLTVFHALKYTMAIIQNSIITYQELSFSCTHIWARVFKISLNFETLIKQKI